VDIATRGLLVVFGATFIGVALLIQRIQSKAASCDLHNPRAGTIAIAIAILSLLMGCTLIAAAFL
jgi:hypothetical protein